MNDDGLILDQQHLATDHADNEGPNSFPLEGVFMRASARYSEPHELVDDPANEPNATVSVNLKGTLGQTNIIFPYMNNGWFTYPQRDFTLKAVGIAASHHSRTSITGYYWNQYNEGTAFTLQRKVTDNHLFDGAVSDRGLTDWAEHRVPDGVVWIDDDVKLDPFDTENEQEP